MIQILHQVATHDDGIITGEEQTNAQKVLDGGIDPFINAYLKWIALGNKDQKDKTEAR